MKKDEFLKTLKAKLSILKEEEQDDIISEYEAHIDLAIKNGKQEEEVIADFGNIADLAHEILDAYKINYERKNKIFYDFESFFEEIIEKIVLFLKKLGTYFTEDTVSVILQVIALLILFVFIKFPFYLFDLLGSSIIETLFASKIAEFFKAIWQFFIWLGYFITIASIFVSYFNKKYGFIEEKRKKKGIIKKVSDKKKNGSSKVLIKPKEKSSIIELFLKIIELIIKIFLVFVSFPIIILLFLLMLALGVIISLMFVGTYIKGALLITIGLIIIIGSVIGIIFTAIFKGGRFL